jgi:hypothetical protein
MYEDESTLQHHLKKIMAKLNLIMGRVNRPEPMQQ